MMSFKPILLATSCSVLCTAAVSYGQSDSSKRDLDILAPVVVEASKTDSNLKNTNASVQVFSARQLEQAGVTTVQELSKLVPGLLIELRGNSTYSGNTLRGISSPNFYSPSVSVYVDGVLQDNTFVMQQLHNVKSVEVLKGPQGTLYGGNSHGGIINIVTYKGTRDTVGNLDLSIAKIRHQGGLSVVTPLSNSFSAGFSLNIKKEDGIIYHTPSRTNDADSVDNSTGSLSFYYEPEDSPYSASLTAKVDKLFSHEEFYLTEKEFDEKKSAPTNFLVGRIPELKRDIQSISLGMSYDISTSTTLKSTTSIQKRQVDRNFVGGDWEEDQDMFSQELRLSTQFGGGSRAVFGAYYETKDWKQDADIPLPQPPGAIITKKNNLKTASTAVYGEGTFAVSDSVELVAGLRYGVDKSEIEFKVPFPGGSFSDSREDSVLLPKLGAGLKLTQNIKLFTTATAGYRPSGFNNNPSGPIEKAGYEAEQSRNLELGLKGTAADNRFRFNSAIYFIELDKVQVNTGVQPTQILENLGKAESRGFELDFSYVAKSMPDTNVNMGVNIGKAIFTGGNEKAGLKDKKLQYSPETSGNLGFQVGIPQTAIPGRFAFGSNAKYTSKFYFDETNTVHQGDYVLADVHLQYQTTSGTKVKLFAENVGDRKYARYKFALPFGEFGVWGRPRTFGIAVSSVF